MRRASTSTPRRGSPTAASSGSAPRSATPPRSCTPACRSASASCARSSTSCEGPGTSAPEGTRVGVLGGTFNPPHVAHLLCAQEAHDQLGLDRVLLMPVAAPPHKEATNDPGPAARIAMCELAVGADER